MSVILPYCRQCGARLGERLSTFAWQVQVCSTTLNASKLWVHERIIVEWEGLLTQATKNYWTENIHKSVVAANMASTESAKTKALLRWITTFNVEAKKWDFYNRITRLTKPINFTKIRFYFEMFLKIIFCIQHFSLYSRFRKINK